MNVLNAAVDNNTPHAMVVLRWCVLIYLRYASNKSLANLKLIKLTPELL